MSEFTNPILQHSHTLNCGGRLLSLEQPLVMGVINVTPDSFFAGSRVNTVVSALRQAEQMLAEGAVILDVGGYSSRPGARDISEEEEFGRVLPVIEAIILRFPETILSVDTFRSRLAKEAVQIGAAIINDISAGEMDPEMIDTIAALQVPYVIMHMQGTPQTMQQNPVYNNVVTDIIDYLNGRLSLLAEKGIKDILIDPGFGFGKTLEQNYKLMKGLREFAILGKPLMAGVSRKSMVNKVLDTEAADALNGTTALHMLALVNGVSVLRVHDVKPAVEAVKIYRAYEGFFA